MATTTRVGTWPVSRRMAPKTCTVISLYDRSWKYEDRAAIATGRLRDIYRFQAQMSGAIGVWFARVAGA